ncbi:MAG: CoA-binding protein [bacterium]
MPESKPPYPPEFRKQMIDICYPQTIRSECGAMQTAKWPGCGQDFPAMPTSAMHVDATFGNSRRPGMHHPELEATEALRRCFNPNAVGIVGVSSRENNLGHWILKSLIDGGFRGAIFPVNPNGGNILGLKVVTDLDALPEPVDLGIVAVPGPAVPEGVSGLGRKGAAGAIIIAGGFAEVGPEGRQLQEEVLQAARQSGVRLFGPNTLGFIHTRSRLNASFSPDMGGSEPGCIGVVSQSGSVCETLYFRCQERGIGFSTLIGTGNEADLDLCDYLEYLLLDPDTTVIALYVEQIRRPRRFIQLLRDRPDGKPVVMFRTGRTSRGKEAAFSHTGAMAGNDAIMSGLCRQLNVTEARSYDDLIDGAIAFSGGRRPKGPRLAVVTGPGAPGVAACDSAVEAGLEMATLSPETSAQLARILPPIASWRNPIDLTGASATNPELATQTMEWVLKDPAVDGVILILGALSSSQGLDDIIQIAQHQPKPVLAATVASLTKNEENRAIVEYLGQHCVPCFLSPERAVRAFQLLGDFFLSPCRFDLPRKMGGSHRPEDPR